MEMCPVRYRPYSIDLAGNKMLPVAFLKSHKYFSGEGLMVSGESQLHGKLSIAVQGLHDGDIIQGSIKVLLKLPSQYSILSSH